MNLFSSPQPVTTQGCRFGEEFRTSGSPLFTEKGKIIDSGSPCIAPENTASKLQHEAFLFSIAGSQAELSFSGKIWEIREAVVRRKVKIFHRVSLCIASERTCSKLQYNPYLISVASSQTELSISGKLGRAGKGSFIEKAKVVDRGSVCIASKSTCSKLQYDPYHISVACFQTELSISGKLGRSGNGSFAKTTKIIDRASLSSVPESTSSNLQQEPFLFSVACSQTELSISEKNWEIRETVIHRKS